MPKGATAHVTLDLRKLEHFVHVADELNVTRAAQQLHLSQQALSTSIRHLERELGVVLFDRAGRGISLTPAGAALLEVGRPLLAAAEAAVAWSREVGRGEAGRLRVGRTPAVTGEEAHAALHDVQRHHPEASLTVEEVYPAALVRRLTDGDLDLGFARAMGVPAHLETAIVGRHRIRLAVATHHRLAGQEQAGWDELAGEELVVWAPPGVSGYTDVLLSRCREMGIHPRHRVSSLQGTPPVTAVAGSDSVALVTAPRGPAADGRTMVIDLVPGRCVPLQAIWLRHTTSRLRRALLEGLAADPAPQS
ncbi:LysR family transcriptional regulator [Pseudonocardia hispaniensis]|uniref:LysR family transcriptional regulator n=1 Tax=Pseudonocardia hispaniensis TaxID=904933 RepID=A0ABW1IYZ3_9PSEU